MLVFLRAEVAVDVDTGHVAVQRHVVEVPDSVPPPPQRPDRKEKRKKQTGKNTRDKKKLRAERSGRWSVTSRGKKTRRKGENKRKKKEKKRELIKIKRTHNKTTKEKRK